VALGSAPSDGHSGRPTTRKAALGFSTPAAADATPAVLDWCLMMLLQLHGSSLKNGAGVQRLQC